MSPSHPDTTVAPDGVLRRVQAIRFAPALRAPAAAWTRPPRVRGFGIYRSDREDPARNESTWSYEKEVARSFQPAPTIVAWRLRDGWFAKADVPKAAHPRPGR